MNMNMNIWPFARQAKTSSDEEVVANAMIEAFRSGQIVSSYLGPLEISEITVRFQESALTASWYPTNNPRSLVIDGKGYPGTSKLARTIVDAARKRGDCLLAENLSGMRTALSAKGQKE